MHISIATKMSRRKAQVRFEEAGSELKAVEIVRRGRTPMIVALYPVLLGLGIVVSSYHVRPSGRSLAERIVLQRRDGGAVDALLGEEMKAAILPVVMGDG